MPTVSSQHIAPVFVRFSIPRSYRYPLRGLSIPILAYVGETITRPGHVKLIDLFGINDGPNVTIYTPTDTIAINQATMSRIDTGVYQYTYNTNTPVSVVGIHSAVFRAVNSVPTVPMVLLSKRVFLFNLQ